VNFLGKYVEIHSQTKFLATPLHGVSKNKIVKL